MLCRTSVAQYLSSFGAFLELLYNLVDDLHSYNCGLPGKELPAFFLAVCLIGLARLQGMSRPSATEPLQ